MAKKKSPTSLRSILVLAFVASTFVSAVAWGAFDDPMRVLIAFGITFTVVSVGLSVLNWAAKDDDVKPGVQRLK